MKPNIEVQPIEILKHLSRDYLRDIARNANIKVGKTKNDLVQNLQSAIDKGELQFSLHAVFRQKREDRIVTLSMTNIL